MAKTLLYSAERVARTLNRLAYEVIERNRGAKTLAICGIRRRGVTLAQALARRISEIEALQLPVNELDVTPYRDDRDARTETQDQSTFPVSVQDRDVILVDDVLFTGRTARAALDAIVHYGRPRSIQLAVLIDRGHREYPIQPDYVGRLIPTKHRERVVVAVEEDFAVYLEE